MYDLDETTVPLAMVLATLLMVFFMWLATPAHSQEAPGCGPTDGLHAMLEKQYGETLTAAGVVNKDFMELLVNRITGTFTVAIRRPDGTSCIVIGGKGFALADPAPRRGSGL